MDVFAEGTRQEEARQRRKGVPELAHHASPVEWVAVALAMAGCLNVCGCIIASTPAPPQQQHVHQDSP
jgi:hypothetical protein